MTHAGDRVHDGLESAPTLQGASSGEGLTRRRLLQGGVLASATVWQTPTLITWRSRYTLPVSPVPTAPPAVKKPPRRRGRPKPPDVQGPREGEAPEAPPPEGKIRPPAAATPRPGPAPTPTETPLVGPAEITSPRRPRAKRPKADIAVTGVEAARLATVGGVALTTGTAAIAWAHRLQRIHAHAVRQVEVPLVVRHRPAVGGAASEPSSIATDAVAAQPLTILSRTAVAEPPATPTDTSVAPATGPVDHSVVAPAATVATAVEPAPPEVPTARYATWCARRQPSDLRGRAHRSTMALTAGAHEDGVGVTWTAMRPLSGRRPRAH